MSLPVPAPDAPRPSLPDCHPETLKHLEESLLNIKAFLALSPASKGEKLRAAVDELRQNFPGVDDLTLAAMCAYTFNAAAYIYGRGLGDPVAFATCYSVGEMAVELTWSLDAPGQS